MRLKRYRDIDALVALMNHDYLLKFEAWSALLFGPAPLPVTLATPGGFVSHVGKLMAYI